jgi:hypothetical protein
MKSRRRKRTKTTTNSSPRRITRNRGRVPESFAEFLALSERAQDVWIRATHVISKMRAENVSLPVASRHFGLPPRTVVRLSKSALKKRANGRYSAKPTDKLLRVLVVPTSEGLREVPVNHSRQATQLAEYWAAVQKYLQTGDASAIRKIRRKTITNSDGKRVRLIKDLAELDRLGSAGVLSFESIYAKAA